MHAGVVRGYVLAGGRSSRMGEDKARLRWGDSTLIQTVISAVSQVSVEVTTVGGDPIPGVRHIPDRWPGYGPVGGIATALLDSDAPQVLVVACDMPGLTPEFLQKLIAGVSGSDAAIAITADGRQHPLCAVWSRSAVSAFESAIAKGEHALQRVTAGLTCVLVEGDSTALANLNYPVEYAEAVRKGEEGLPHEEFLHYVEFRHVYKTFDKPVLVDSCFYVDAGETVAIIGRSGVGKSVTLSHIMGFLKPDQGRVIVAYQDITDMGEADLRHIRKKVTMVFQNGALFDSITVGENILFSLELREDYSPENKEEVVNGLLGMVDLLDAKDMFPSDLSTGQRRAVAIARALAAQPECILYDEPTTMVDPIMSDHLSNLMLKLKQQLNLTSVVVTHDLDLMRKVADKVVMLHEGRVIYFGRVADLDKSDEPHIEEFLAMDRVEI